MKDVVGMLDELQNKALKNEELKQAFTACGYAEKSAEWPKA